MQGFSARTIFVSLTENLINNNRYVNYEHNIWLRLEMQQTSPSLISYTSRWMIVCVSRTMIYKPLRAYYTLHTFPHTKVRLHALECLPSCEADLKWLSVGLIISHLDKLDFLQKLLTTTKYRFKQVLRSDRGQKRQDTQVVL